MHTKLPRHWMRSRRSTHAGYGRASPAGILDLLNVHGLTAQQARSLLGKLHLLIDLGEQLGGKTIH